MKKIKLLLLTLLLGLLVGCSPVETYESSLNELTIDYDEQSDIYSVFLTETGESLQFYGKDVKFRANYKDEVVVKEFGEGMYELYIYFDIGE